MRVSRRTFLAGSASAIGVIGLPMPIILGQAKPRVVVVGGGAGGVTAAKYIARDSKGAIDVTLVEPLKRYQTCFHSNLYLGGVRDYESITHGYEKLAAAYGVKMNHQWASAIDRDRKEVVLEDGSRLGYDRLVLSPGISLNYASVPGWGKEHEDAMPHAWIPGPQTQILKKRLDEVPNGGVIVMIAPPNPYRCPPGPYERVSMMAHALRKAGKTNSKIFVLDPKETFSKQALFLQGWERHYKGMVEWLGPKVHDGVKSVDPKSNTVVTGFETYKAALVNVIPAQTAGKIAVDAKLTNAGAFCQIDAANMKSVVDSNIYILGDACIAGDMPKSGFSANSQAKVAALMIRAELTNAQAFPARYSNTCWSLIDTDDAVKVGGRYEAKEGKIAATETFVSQTNETADVRKQTQAENMGWYSGIIADMFA
jgi:sulfide dehydrogenase [flavocytochrome c] flavoprotein subunit